MRISVLSVYARSSDEVTVVMEIRDGERAQKESLLLGLSDLADIHIEVGECDSVLYDRIYEASRVHLATKTGLRALGYGRLSEKALLRKLHEKGFDRKISEQAIKRIKQGGYIDEEKDAFECARSYAKKLFGKKRIAAELFKKGYSDDAVRNAIFALEDSETDFAGLCYERVSHLRELPADRNEKNKLVASLLRYGFSMDEIKEALRRAYRA